MVSPSHAHTNTSRISYTPNMRGEVVREPKPDGSIPLPQRRKKEDEGP